MTNPITKNYINYLNTGKNIFFRADIHLIGGCNFKCVMCDNWKREVEMKFDYEELQKFLLILKKTYNCNYVRFHGQEPTMYSKLEDLILFSKNLGLKVAIKTNAWLISDLRLVKILKGGLDELYLSIDGPNSEIHDNIRGVNGSYNKNLDIIVKAKKINSNLKIYINSVVMKSNYSILKNMLELGFKYNLDRVSFVFLNDKNRKDIKGINLNKNEFINFFKNDVIEIYKKSDLYKIPVDFSPFISDFSGKSNSFIINELENNFSYYLDEIEEFYKGNYGKYFYDKYGCFGPLDHCSINYNGDMFGCCVVERDRNNAVGNLFKDKLGELWNSEKYIEYRENANQNCSYNIKCASNFYTRKSLFKSIYLDDNLYSKNNPINYYRYLKELKNEEYKLVQELKISKFKKILLHFYDNLIFYKNLLDNNKINREYIENINSLEFIKKLPILDKKILKENIDEILKLSDGKEYLNGKTSGNSGDKLEFRYPLDFKRYIKQISIFSEESKLFFSSSYFSVTPINCNQTIINDLSEPDYVKKVYITIGNFEYKKELFFNIKKQFNENKNIKFLHGDSKYILFLIIGFKKFNLELPNLDGISLSYSYTNKSLKQFIENSFKTKSFDNYGCSEVGPISSYKDGKKVIFGDNILVEELNTDIIISDLDNFYFPFIRYSNGDLGKIDGDLIDIYGKKTQIINNKNLREIDNFFYNNFNEIIIYQFEGEKLFIIGEVNLDILREKLKIFLNKSFEIYLLDDEFLKVGDCSKFKTII